MKNMHNMILFAATVGNNLDMPQNGEKKSHQVLINLPCLYALRHSMVTLSLAAGVHLKAVAEKAGHADVSMVLETYGHVMENQRADTVAKLGGVLYA